MNNDKRKLQDLDIDKYVSWYKDLSKKAHALEVWKDKRNRYILASFSLNIRNINDKKNEISIKVAAAFDEKAKRLQVQINEVNKYLGEIEGNKIYFIPSFNDWQAFDFLNNYSPLVDFINQKIENSALPEIEILKDELERKNNEDFKLLGYFESGTPFLYQNADAFKFIFANEVSNINYCRYLAKRIKELEHENSETIPVLKWDLNKKKLSELIKALHCTKAFGDVTETKIKDAFEKMFTIDLQRHFTNVNELQDKKVTGLYTTELKEAIKNLTFNDKNKN